MLSITAYLDFVNALYHLVRGFLFPSLGEVTGALSGKLLPSVFRGYVPLPPHLCKTPLQAGPCFLWVCPHLQSPLSFSLRDTCFADENPQILDHQGELLVLVHPVQHSPLRQRENAGRRRLQPPPRQIGRRSMRDNKRCKPVLPAALFSTPPVRFTVYQNW